MKRVGFILLGLVILITLPTFIPTGEKEESGEIEIFLVSNEIHTDLALPVKNDVFDWTSFIDPADFKSGPSQWIEIGSGDRDFLFEIPTWDKFDLKVLLDALFWPDPAIMHVNFLGTHPTVYQHRVLRISRERYRLLVDSIKKSFVLDKGKPVLIPGRGYSESDNFYEGKGDFSIVRTCNVWTSEKLASANLLHPLWSPTKYGLMFLWK